VLVIIAWTATCEQSSAMHSRAPQQRANACLALAKGGEVREEEAKKFSAEA
jgi:hypothetical protein